MINRRIGQKYRIAVAGTGYVGLSLATLLARHNRVTAVDIDPEKVEMINHRISPIQDRDIEEYLKEKELDLTATLDGGKAYEDADFVIIAVPTNYDQQKNSFDCSAVEEVIGQVLESGGNAVMVIRSTIPVGYTKAVREKFRTDRIFFSPEFLREGRALHDNLYPSRIILGVDGHEEWIRAKAEQFGSLLKESALKVDIPVLMTGSDEAESVKLFSNTYLAMRVGFFNEVDSYAEAMGLNAREIIEGICLEPRIGTLYNNPSFGYGGYCLPKDTKQIRANFGEIPQRLISAIVETNDVRKEHIVREILRRVENVKDPVVGIYRLTMKAGSDNFRQSAVLDIMAGLGGHGVRIVIYEPTLEDATTFRGYPVEHEFQKFAEMSHVIVANRYEHALDPVKDRVYTRDIFLRN